MSETDSEYKKIAGVIGVMLLGVAAIIWSVITASTNVGRAKMQDCVDAGYTKKECWRMLNAKTLHP